MVVDVDEEVDEAERSSRSRKEGDRVGVDKKWEELEEELKTVPKESKELGSCWVMCNYSGRGMRTAESFKIFKLLFILNGNFFSSNVTWRAT